MALETGPLLRFILDGFIPDRGFRLFTFQGFDARQRVNAAEGRREFTVRIDLALIRTYGIHVQELPLLCRELLERCADSESARHFIFTEEDMRSHQASRMATQAAAAQKKMMSRKQVPQTASRAWRTTAPLNVGSYA